MPVPKFHRFHLHLACHESELQVGLSPDRSYLHQMRSQLATSEMTNPQIPRNLFLVVEILLQPAFLLALPSWPFAAASVIFMDS